MTKWTPEQEYAINKRDKNLLVSAAAGSGKTAVLVERIISLLIKDQVDIDKILVVTFTKAAAAEMRERISAVLTQEAEKESENEDFLRKQLNLLNKASISTLHSFCTQLLRKNFFSLGLDPAFKVADQADLLLIKKEVMEEVLEEAYSSDDPDFKLLIDSYTENKGDEKIEELIFNLYDFILSQPQPFKWLEEKINNFQLSQEEIFQSAWMKSIKKSVLLDLDGASHLLAHTIEIAQDPLGPDAYLSALYSDKELMENLKKDVDLYFSGQPVQIAEKLDFKKFTSIKKENVLDEDLQERVKKYRDDYKKILNKLFKEELFSRELSSYSKDINDLYHPLKSLYKLTWEFHNLFQKKKLDKSLVDFNDLEHFSLQVLSNQESALALQEEFSYIFVDEYQDSNPVQEKIINSIRRERNLFLVGDVKQSIYKFRLADPELFIEKYKTYSKNPHDDEALNERIDLAKNFRTRKEILQGINYIFTHLMREEIGGLDYKEDVWLWPGASYGDRDDPEIELNIINKAESIAADDFDLELLDLNDAETEAHLIADRIKELLGSPVYDAKKGNFYPADWKDITVLFRSVKNWSLVFNDVFIKAGIPVYADDNQGYFDSLEIKIFLSLLKVIDNKKDDLSLLTLMRSPIGNFTTEDLLEIRKNAADLTYHEAAEAFQLNDSFPLGQKLKEFYQKIDDWAQRAKFESTEEFLWSLMLETGFYHYAGAMVKGKERQANLKLLLEKAASLEKRGQPGLFNFIRFSDDFQRARGDMGSAKTIGENENVVRLMTIHKSKGLEFPIVILAAAGKKFNKTDLRGDFLFHKDLGLGPVYVNPQKRIKRESLPRLALKKEILLENMAEEMRVLYVALTRAKDRLILTATSKDLEKDQEKWLRERSSYEILKAASYLDWLGLVLYSEKGWHEAKDWKVNIINKESIQKEIIREEFNKLQFKEFLEDFSDKLAKYKDDDLNDRFSWAYPRPHLSKIPSKITVSELNQMQEATMAKMLYQIPPLVKTPNFLEGKKSFTAAEKGLITHFFMQNCSFDSLAGIEDIKKEIKRMEEKELLTQAEAQQLDPLIFLQFFNTELGQRMIKSGEAKREVSFVYKSRAPQEVFIQGVIDCYFPEDDQLVLLDYKTDFVHEGFEEDLVKKYAKQLDLYKEALEKISGKKVKESYIYSFSANKAIQYFHNKKNKE